MIFDSFLLYPKYLNLFFKYFLILSIASSILWLKYIMLFLFFIRTCSTGPSLIKLLVFLYFVCNKITTFSNVSLLLTNAPNSVKEPGLSQTIKIISLLFAKNFSNVSRSYFFLLSISMNISSGYSIDKIELST